jgi:hypothetical protein
MTSFYFSGYVFLIEFTQAKGEYAMMLATEL